MDSRSEPERLARDAVRGIANEKKLDSTFWENEEEQG